MLELEGIFVPVITPLAADGQLDVVGLERVANRCLAEGAAGLVALGTTGEPTTLTEPERDAVIDTCARVCEDAGRPMIVGLTGNDTRAVVVHAERLASRRGVDGLLVLVPHYTRPPEAGIREHYRLIAEASEVPVLLYNHPGRTGTRISAETLFDLAESKAIAGVKQSVGVLDRDAISVIRDAPPSLSVLTGDDELLYASLRLGAAGAIMASAHVRTSRFVGLWRQIVDGDLRDAAMTARELDPLIDALFAEPNPMVIKAVLQALGEIDCARMRPPFSDASEDVVARALAAEAAVLSTEAEGEASRTHRERNWRSDDRTRLRRPPGMSPS